MSTIPATTRFVAPSGLTLALHDWGGDGPPVLLAHATGFHGRVWAPIAAGLVAAGRRVWSFDFRGHGDSDRSPDGRYAWSEFADDALAVAHHVAITGEPGLLAAGHSKGAASLLAGAVAEPGAYARIWCFEPILFSSDERVAPADNPLSAGARRRRARWPSRDVAFDSYHSRPPFDVLDPRTLRAYVDHGMRDEPDGTVSLKCRPDDEATMYRMGPSQHLWPRLGAVSCPCLIACGEHTDAIRPRFAARIAERIPVATLEVWEGSDHFGPLADPERAVASMLAFAASSAVTSP